MWNIEFSLWLKYHLTRERSKIEIFAFSNTIFGLTMLIIKFYSYKHLVALRSLVYTSRQRYDDIYTQHIFTEGLVLT